MLPIRVAVGVGVLVAAGLPLAAVGVGVLGVPLAACVAADVGVGVNAPGVKLTTGPPLFWRVGVAVGVGVVVLLDLVALRRLSGKYTL